MGRLFCVASLITTTVLGDFLIFPVRMAIAALALIALSNGLGKLRLIDHVTAELAEKSFGVSLYASIFICVMVFMSGLFEPLNKDGENE
jgi:hypothetical protein